MDQKEILSLVPCYKLNFDQSKIVLADFLDKISDFGDILFYDNYIYIWLDIEITKDKMMKNFKKWGISEIYCEHIQFDLSKYAESDANHLVIWWAEHYNQTIQKLIEIHCQDTLQQIQNNIKKASDFLDEKISEAKK